MIVITIKQRTADEASAIAADMDATWLCHQQPLPEAARSQKMMFCLMLLLAGLVVSINISSCSVSFERLPSRLSRSRTKWRPPFSRIRPSLHLVPAAGRLQADVCCYRRACRWDSLYLLEPREVFTHYFIFRLPALFETQRRVPAHECLRGSSSYTRQRCRTSPSRLFSFHDLCAHERLFPRSPPSLE